MSTSHYPAADGWYYDRPLDMDGKDARKLVELHQGGMRWIGIRAWHVQGGYWTSNGEPEIAEVVAWRDLPAPTRGFWDSGRFVLLPQTIKCEECGYVSTEASRHHASDCVHAQGSDIA